MGQQDEHADASVTKIEFEPRANFYTGRGNSCKGTIEMKGDEILSVLISCAEDPGIIRRFLVMWSIEKETKEIYNRTHPPTRSLLRIYFCVLFLFNHFVILLLSSDVSQGEDPVGFTPIVTRALPAARGFLLFAHRGVHRQ